MKNFTVLLLIVLSVWVHESQAMFDGKAFEEYFSKCAQKLKLSKDDMEKLAKKENLTDEKYKCLAKCVGEESGLIENGMFSKEGAQKMIPQVYKDNAEHQKKGEEVIEGCNQKLKENPATGCDVGPAVFGCLIKGAEDNQILPKMEEE